MNFLCKIFCIFILLGFLPLSCDNCDNEYLGKYNFDIERITNFDFDPYISIYDTSTKIIIDTNLYTIVFSNYDAQFDLQLNISDEKIVHNRIFQFNTTNTAYALSKQQCYNIKEYSIKNKIDSIVIRSDNDFNNFPAGVNLNAFFSIKLNSYQNTDFTSIEEVVRYWNNNFEFYNNQNCSSTTDSLSLVNCYNMNYNFHCFLKLHQRPLNIKNHRFTIFLYKSNGIILQQSAKRIIWL